VFCDVDAERAAKIAAQYGAKGFTKIDELADQVEALSIVVPTDKHREVAGALIEKGVHLLVEKPIAATTAEAEDMVALAQKKDVILQSGISSGLTRS